MNFIYVILDLPHEAPLGAVTPKADPTRGGSVSYFPHEADLKLANRVASGDRVVLRRLP